MVASMSLNCFAIVFTFLNVFTHRFNFICCSIYILLLSLAWFTFCKCRV
uniref:Uncharacterized protein n=1 Tax=Arundo donax TaxID=35708 RepID=A0A0A8ZMY2_ARUDO